ncbi:MAG TPA: TonB-dependent receptor [Gemmatimonadaceae bacterium]|nr:TonB-dependent receptor [Gemmatimonadaceae bacterium]
MRSLALALALLAPGLALPLAATAQTSTGSISGRVTDRAGNEPLVGATISISGTQLGAITRDNGTYRVVVPAGRHELRVRLIGYGLARDSITVEPGATATVDFGLERAVTALEEVAITGTRGEERTVLDAPVPIDVLTAADLKTTGRTETAQVIQALAPSFNFPRPTVADGTDHVRPATLRGLGPDQLLVLINGKRRHNSALVNVNGTIGRGSTGVDLNAIPANMIERIEVLRDGAAAQYGSDAISGVINIILKSTSPGEASTTVGSAYSDFGGDNVNDGEVFQGAANYGLPVGQNGFFQVGGEYRDRGYTNRTRPDLRQQYFAGDAREATFNRINHRQGDAATTDAVAMVNTGYTFGTGIQLYSFGAVSQRTGEAAGFFRRANDDRTVRLLHPDGFLPMISTDITDGSGTLGVRGTLAGVRWDLSGVFGQNAFFFNVENSNNASLGNASPTDFYVGSLKFAQTTVNLDLFREFALPTGAPFRVAAGAEFRADDYEIGQGDPASYIDGGVRVLDANGAPTTRIAAVGAQVFPGFRPSDVTDAYRDNVAVYADFESDLTQQLLLGLALRYEDYSDFGSTTTGKVTARVAPIPQIAFRGAVQTGFRAPSLAQSFFSSTATNFISGVPFEVRTFPVSSREAQLLGARPLKPEKSRNYSLGVALEPAQALSLTVDAYQIDIDDRIVFSENFTGTAIRDYFISQGITGVTGGRFFTNAIDTRTKGIDVVANYGINLRSRGVVRMVAGFNANRTKVRKVVVPTPPQLGDLSETLFGRVERARIEEGQPRNNFLASVQYDYGRWGFNVRTQRFGQVVVRNAPATPQPPDQTFGAKAITDVNVSTRLGNRVTLTAGADNILDVYPDENSDRGNVATNYAGNANFGIFAYNGVSPFGFNGRFVYLRATIGLQ